MMKKINFIIVFILMLLLIPNFTSAKVLEFDNTINLQGEHNSSKLVLANNLSSDASIDGLAMMAGNQVNVGGYVSYGGYAGNIVNISSEVEKDLYVAGNMITLMGNAKLGRDVFIVGNIININTNIKRNLNIAGSSVNLSDITIEGNACIDAENIILNENTVIKGSLTVYSDTTITGLNENNIGKYIVNEREDVEIVTPIIDRVKIFLFELASKYLVALVILIVFTKLRTILNNIELKGNNIVTTTLIGFASLIAIPIASLILMITGFFLPIGLMSLAVYACAVYLSTIFVANILGHNLWKLTKKKENIAIEILIGVASIKIISLVPIVGGLVNAVILFYGFGIVFNLIKEIVVNR